MTPDDLAKFYQWFAGANPNGDGQLPVQDPGQDPQGAAGAPQPDVYWPDSWSGAATPEDHANAILAQMAMERAGSGLSPGSGGPDPQAAMSQLQQLANGTDPWSGAGAGYTPEDHANAILLSMGRRPAASSQLGRGLLSHTDPAKNPAPPTVQELITPHDTDPMNDWWRQMSDQGNGTAASPWPQDAPLQVPPGLKSQAAPPLPTIIGPHGYVVLPGDEDTLARLIYAEGNSSPEEMAAIGWATVNRIGVKKFGRTLDEVVNHKKAFSSAPASGDPSGGSAQWRLTADPSKLSGPAAIAWRRAHDAARGILNGTIADPTGGAQYFFSSENRDGDPVSAAPPGFFTTGFADGSLQPSQYQGHNGYKSPGHPTRNYFAMDAPISKRRAQ